jgi:hypothetical protein
VNSLGSTKLWTISKEDNHNHLERTNNNKNGIKWRKMLEILIFWLILWRE